jgi:hypothetical protein
MLLYHPDQSARPLQPGTGARFTGSKEASDRHHHDHHDDYNDGARACLAANPLGFNRTAGSP